MKPVKDATIDTLEEVALAGAAQLKAFFTYQGNNPTYLDKAKLGASSISGYARLRASETNRMSVELSVAKFNRNGKK